MYAYMFLWVVLALGVVSLAILFFCLIVNVVRAFVTAVFVEQDDVAGQVIVAE